jgi:uncharacterized protein (TIGR00290 family)
MKKRKVSISWSGGKDSAFALYRILLSGEYDVIGLHTVIGEETRRVGLHGVREELIEAQAKSLKLPLRKLYLKTSNNHDVYSELMRTFYLKSKMEGIEGIVFGDIFLEDLRKFREDLLLESQLFALFPIWNVESGMLIHDFINTGFKTLICSADVNFFKEEQVGKTIDFAFLKSLPVGVDPCGENGEFHTFVYDGPIFQHPIPVTLDSVIKCDYTFKKKNDDGDVDEVISSYWFQELIAG